MANGTAIKKGDTVMLKSSGPIMSVESVEEGRAYCVWFLNGKMEKASFSVDILEAVDPATGNKV